MKLNYEEEKGMRIECTFEGNVQDYALMWLNLSNNAKEHTDVFYRIGNYYDNDLYVVCNEDETDNVVDYLKRIGLIIKDKEDVTVVIPFVEDYESEKEYCYIISNQIDS